MALPVTVDFHAHAQSPKAGELIAQAPNNPGAEPNPHNEHLQQTRYRTAFSDLSVRLQTMDRQRIDMQVVSPAPIYAYWADEDLSAQIAAASNEHVAEICASHRDRFVGLAHVSLQSPARAAQQLASAMDSLGLKGVEIGTRVEGVELDDPSSTPSGPRRRLARPRSSSTPPARLSVNALRSTTSATSSAIPWTPRLR